MVGWADVVHLTGTYSFPTIPTLVVCRHANLLFSRVTAARRPADALDDPFGRQMLGVGFLAHRSPRNENETEILPSSAVEPVLSAALNLTRCATSVRAPE